MTFPLPDFAKLESQRQTIPFLAQLCNVSKYTARRWWHEGLTWREADLLACRFGRMPYEVWPDWDMPFMSWRRIEALDESLALRGVAA